MTLLSKEDYTELFIADLGTNGALAKVLKSNGKPNWTVCPTCGVDDFLHVKGCILDKEIWREISVRQAMENDE